MSIINTKILPENQYWLWGDTTKKDFFLYVELQGKKVESQQKKPPLNIALVIDHSGSMEGDKLVYAKKAIDFVIDNVSSEDLISIVQYDNEIEVISKSAKVQHKEVLHSKVKQISARGTTNLSGGMLEGYNQVNTTKQSNYVNRVLLLSDGLANEGITDPVKLQHIVQKKFREEGIALSTFGIGADFDEKLMTNLSEYGGANYYFIDSPDKIPQIFAKELEGLLTVVAQNTRLKVTFPDKTFTCQKVYGFPHTIEKNQIFINFNDIFSSEKKAILIKFEAQKSIEHPFQFEVELNYDDVAETYHKVTHKEIISVDTTLSAEIQKSGMNHEVLANIALFESNDWLEQAADEIDKHNFDFAKQITLKNKVYLETIFKIILPNEELKKQYAAVVDYESKIDQMNNMDRESFAMAQKTVRNISYNQKRKKN
ncbi:MAG: VWA domain-containing protein [Thermoflexibacter sp.]|jgi:Ca-activated chloride channel family protein|nr:VWA domain-containing protein [Thermoflexibacter sp.]